MKDRPNPTQPNPTQPNRARQWFLRYLILSLLTLPVILSTCARQKTTPAVTTPVRASNPEVQSPVGRPQRYVVSRVIDGDTIVLHIDNKEVKVRLIGVDTPETVHPQKPVEAYGKEASIFLSNLLKGEKVYLEYEKGTQETDKYGRLLAYLYRVPDKLFINLEIIRQGYGHAYTKYPFKYMDLFRDTERQARESAKGLWAPDAGQKPSAIPESKLSEVKCVDAKRHPDVSGDDSGKQKQEEPVEITVYVTRTGSKYHRVGCRYLAKSCIPMSLKEAKARYGPCSVCNPPR